LRVGPVRGLHGADRRPRGALVVTQIGALGDAEIITIEGLGTVDKPHPLQRAFGTRHPDSPAIGAF
jgi:hypothetical protein